MDIVISGAGISGLTLSHLLQRDGHKTTIVEKSPSLREDGYMMDFFGTGYDVAEKLGLLNDLERIHYPIPRLAFIDPRGREQVAVNYNDIRKLFNGRHFNFMRGDLERLLYSRVSDDVDIRFGTTIKSLQQNARELGPGTAGSTNESD